MDDLTGLSDSALIDRLQRGAFSYITDYTDAETGLVADTSRPESPCSIAVVGFALSCYPIAVKNGWMSTSRSPGCRGRMHAGSRDRSWPYPASAVSTMVCASRRRVRRWSAPWKLSA